MRLDPPFSTPENVPHMNKSALIYAVRKALPSQPPDYADRVVRAFAGALRKKLCGPGVYKVNGLGLFTVTIQPPRIGIDPRTGKPVTQPGSRLISFTPDRDLLAP